MADMTSQYIIDFWFSDRVRPLQFRKSREFDEEITRKFLPIYERAAAGELEQWLKSAHGSLALILVLDQFSRNMFRDNPRFI